MLVRMRKMVMLQRRVCDHGVEARWIGNMFTNYSCHVIVEQWRGISCRQEGLECASLTARGCLGRKIRTVGQGITYANLLSDWRLMISLINLECRKMS